MLQGDSAMRDIYLPTAQHDRFSQDLCPVPFVEQHNARGQLTSYSHTHTLLPALSYYITFLHVYCSVLAIGF